MTKEEIKKLAYTAYNIISDKVYPYIVNTDIDIIHDVISTTSVSVTKAITNNTHEQVALLNTIYSEYNTQFKQMEELHNMILTYYRNGYTLKTAINTAITEIVKDYTGNI